MRRRLQHRLRRRWAIVDTEAVPARAITHHWWRRRAVGFLQMAVENQLNIQEAARLGTARTHLLGEATARYEIARLP